MHIRRVIKQALPMYVAHSVQRVRGVRRAEVRASIGQMFSPRWHTAVETSRAAFFPPTALTKAATVVDIGAHEGHWSSAILDVLAPLKLVAVEPAPKSFRVLTQRLAGRVGVTLHNCALGDRDDKVPLHLSSHADFNSLLPLSPTIQEMYPKVSAAGATEVALTTLDRLVCDEEEISLLKMDVQGSEPAVLRGATDSLSRTRVVLLEMNFVSHYQGNSLFPELHGHMEGAGFSLHCFAYQHHDPHTGRLLWADAVYLRN